MRVTTLQRREIDVDERSIVRFVEPMPGFPGLTRFIIYQTSDGPLYWLQSVEDQKVACCLLAPFQAGLDYPIEIGPADAARINAEGEKDIVVYTLVVLDRDREKIRTNLRAPILVSRSSNLAVQLILDDPRLPIQFPLASMLAAKA